MTRFFDITLLSALYVVFCLFTFVTLNAELEVYYCMINAFLFSVSVIFLLQKRTISLFYVNMLSLFIFMYSVQRAIGPEYLIFRTQNSEVTLKPAVLLIVHIFFFMIGSITTPLISSSVHKFRLVRFPTAIIATVLSWIIILIVIMIIGSDYYTLTRYDRFLAEIESNAGVRVFEIFSKSILYVLTAGLILRGTITRNSWPMWLIIIVVVLSGFIVSNPANTARFISLSGIFLVSTALIFRFNKQHKLATYIILIPPILIMILPVTSLMRLGTKILTFDAVLDMFTSLEFSAFQLYLDAVTYFSDKSQITSYTISAILIMVPRILWAGKEQAIGPEVAAAEGYYSENVALPSFFNFFADYGIFGLILGSIAMGWLFSRLELSLIRRFDFYNRRQMYGLIMLVMVPIISRGDMSTACISIYGYLSSYEVVRFLLRLAVGPPRSADFFSDTS